MAAYDPLVRESQHHIPADGLGHSAYATPGMLHGGEEDMSPYPASQHLSFIQHVEASPPISSTSQHGNEYDSHWQARPEVGHSTALPSSVDDDSSSSVDEPDANEEPEPTSNFSDHPPPGVAAIGGQYQDMEQHLIPNGVNWFMSVFV